jgi:3-hydroxyacyl-CoA dehydrogenase/3a,7a,12a-trihydroxy-5b-cholest-24-enoyl-CoA hydratase
LVLFFKKERLGCFSLGACKLMQDLRFDGQAVIVTGAARGLGLAYARLLAARGALVVVNDLGVALDGSGASDGPAREAAEQIRNAGGHAIAEASDVATEAGAQAVVEACLRQWGRVDAVINNAGNFLGQRPLQTINFDDYANLWRVHMGSTYHVCHAVLPHFQRAGAGRIVNSSSNQTLYGAPNSPDYAAAKGAVLGFTLSLAAATRGTNIRVNLIGPGAYTRMVSVDNRSVEFTRKLETGLHADLAAPAAVWLCHPDCRRHGEVFEAYGGRFSRVVIGELPGFWDFHPSLESVADGFENLAAALPLWQAENASAMAWRVLTEAESRRVQGS